MKNLENILSHSDCLSQEQMQQYLENSLDKEQTLQLENHITDCMFCSDALEGLQQLSHNENQQAVGEIKHHIESILFAEQEENVPPTVEKPTTVEPQPQMTVKKGGKRISLAAAAGLFFLIFGAGLAVFSYINNNTNWLKNDQAVASTKGVDNHKDLKLNETKNTGRELETISITDEELNFNEPTPTPDNSRKDNKKNIEKRKEEKVSSKDRERFNTKTASSVEEKEKEVVAKNSIKNDNTSLLDEAAESVENAKQTPTIAANRTYTPTPITKELQKKSIPAIAKTKVENDFGNLADKNTYTQKKFEGKLKDINTSPAVGYNDRTKGKKKTSKYKSEKSARDIDVIQSQGYGNYYNNSKDNYSNTNKGDTGQDNYSKANKAYDKGDYKQSIKLYKRALRQKDLKNREDVLYQLALAYEKAKNFSKAEKIYKELEGNAPFENRARSGLKRLRAR